ncbi:hypothetical protein DFH07DRAFT_968250 [Mycena maculata]|uniref:Uncharacterized protein n=1 Tax=Mycena maculata TaxID=230809 RepID=A0AAD7MU66_9AGAR|nr:hypothetical protein DFH07DRAFT_968250 [Mycena maculata]
MSRSSHPRTSNALEIALSIADTAIAVAATTAEFTPVPYIHHLCSLASSILKTIEEVKENKVEFQRLATDAYELVHAIKSMADEGRTISFRLKRNLEDLTSTLSDITDTAQLKEFQARISQSLTVFELKTQIRTHENVVEMREELRLWSLERQAQSAPTYPHAPSPAGTPAPVLRLEPPQPGDSSLSLASPNSSSSPKTGTPPPPSAPGDFNHTSPVDTPSQTPPLPLTPVPPNSAPSLRPPPRPPLMSRDFNHTSPVAMSSQPPSLSHNTPASVPIHPSPSAEAPSGAGSHSSSFFGDYSTVSIGGNFRATTVHGTQINNNNNGYDSAAILAAYNHFRAPVVPALSPSLNSQNQSSPLS